MSSVGTAIHPESTFVVVNWNRKELLRQCLRSLEQQRRSDFEVVLVDNGSTDGSLDGLDQFVLPCITLIRNPKNYGYVPAVNQGIEAARGRFIALVNNDAVLDPLWLEEILHGFSLDPQVGMCACKILLAQAPHLIDKTGHVLYPDGQNYGRGHGEEDRGQYERVEEVLCPDGAAAVYRAEVFESVGLFDEEFFAYGDDAELGLRAQLYGWKCLYIPSAVAHHHHSATFGPYTPQKIFLVERNRIWLAIKLLPFGLLVQVPFYSLIRYSYSLWALVKRSGDVGRAARESSIWRILWAVVRAQAAAALGLPCMLSKRREIHRRRQVSAKDFVRLLRQHSIGARKMSLSSSTYAEQPSTT